MLLPLYSLARIVNRSRRSPYCHRAILGLAVSCLISCDTPQKLALKELAQFGIEPSGRSLLAAVQNKDTRIAGLLMEARVYTEHRDHDGRTPLGLAVDSGDVPLAYMLLNSGANVNASLGNQSSVLGIAALKGDVAMVETLLAAGAKTDGLMPDGEKILPWAIREGRHELVRSMMKADSDPHLKDRQGNPLLHIAMEAGRRDLMASLIELGADAAATNAAGETTIHLALRQGWMDAIPKLARAGADPNAPGKDGKRLLEQAVADGELEKATLFLKIGADPNLPCHQGQSSSPLRQVFERADPAMFEAFLQHGVRPPESHWNHWLQESFNKRDAVRTRLLLSHGATDPGPGKNGYLLAESAVLAGEPGFVKMMLDYGLPAGRAIFLAIQQNDADLAHLLLSCGVSPDVSRFPTRVTPLSLAIGGRQDRIAESLLSHGADGRLLMPAGQSAFHLAVATGCHRTVKRLLDQGADPNAPFVLPVEKSFLQHMRLGAARWALKNDRNVTPLMVAADSGSIQTARYLMEAGAKVNVRTKSSALWPINFASRRSDVGMMRLFLGQDPLREERHIEIRLSEQKARLYDAEGKEIFSTKVSTGKKGFSTPTGEFVITNKHRDWTSTLYHASMPYFQRLSCGDFGLHQGNVPGYPASHGCIRLPYGVAAKLFGMTQTGDRVRIVP